MTLKLGINIEKPKIKPTMDTTSSSYFTTKKLSTLFLLKILMYIKVV